MIIIMIMMMMMMYQVVYEPRCKSRDPSPTKPVGGSRVPSRAGGRKQSRARTPSVKMSERLVRALSQVRLGHSHWSRSIKVVH